MVNEQKDMKTGNANPDEKLGSKEVQNEETVISSDALEQYEKDVNFDDESFEYDEEESDKKHIYIQYRIYNNHGVMTGDNASFESISIKDSAAFMRKNRKDSVFKDKSAMQQWLSDNYESYDMALMIATATFDTFPDTWIVQASERLFETFEDHEEMKRSYALEEILGQFEAEICKGEMNTYTGKVDINIIRLTKTEYQDQILKYIWQQYPQLQDKVIMWLQSFNAQTPASMSKRALEIMGKLASWDYYYFLNKMIPRIANDKNILTDMMIGQILIMLNQEEDYQGNVYNVLHSWRRERQVHYLLTTLFVCSQLQDKSDILKDVIACYLERTLDEMRDGKIPKYQLSLYDFLGVGIRSYTFYRILIEQLYDRIFADTSVKEKRNLYELFLRLFAIDISQSSPEKGDDVILIKLCMVNHVAIDQICYIWQMIWQCNYYKKLLYNLMVRYDIKVYNTNSAYCIEKFVNKALKNIYTREMRNDICNKIHRRAGNA